MKFVALDLETTGLDPVHDKIIEIALIKFESETFEVVDTFSTLVHPTIAIPEVNSTITGITNEMVKDAPFFQSILEEVQKFISDCPIVWHNVQFDISFLKAKWLQIENNIFIDTFFLANTLLFHLPSISLESIADFFRIPIESAHRAYDDTLASIKVLESLKNYFLQSPQYKIEALNFVLAQSNDIHIAYIRQFLWLSQPIDFEKFKKAYLTHISFYEYAQIEEIQKLNTTSDAQNIYTSLDIEKRENQKKLLLQISQIFEQKTHAIIEAPTGIWKTFAYAIPSIVHAISTGEQVIISTKTKLLQDQIFEKDLAYLKHSLPYSFSYCKLKGQDNYVSIKSFFEEIALWDIPYDKVSFLSKIALWLFETKLGELDDLNLYSNENFFVKNVHSSMDETLNETNPYREYEFLYKSRKKLETSQIIVVNHSLLFQDILYEWELSKRMKNLVIDEAHGLEDTITSSLKKRYSYKDTQYIFSQILFKLKKSNSKNIFDISKKMEEISATLLSLDEILFSYLSSVGNDETSYVNVLIPEILYDSGEVLTYAEKLHQQFTQLEIISKEEKKIASELFILREIANIFSIVFDRSKKTEYIQILTYSQYNGIWLEYTVFHIDTFMQETIWSKTQSLVLLSATLQIWGDFWYIKKLLWAPENIDTTLYESDFDYEKQSELILLKNIWSVKSNFWEILDFFKSFFALVWGKTLVLFTSHSSVKRAYTELTFPLRNFGVSVLAQWFSGSKYRILKKFIDAGDKSVIFWTDSFWEWIDIPNQNLKYLIIHKFPFTVPTDPIFVARSSLYTDAFSQYAIPKSIIKLKQWFWRLIRSKNDVGKVILLDDRIHTTWWANFFNAFPKNIPISQVTPQEILEKIDKNKL